jgi:PilZ domain
MGKRREPRIPVEVPVRIFGTDRNGKIFSENITTVDVSQNGAKLKGVKAQINLEEIIGVTCGRNKVHFRVKWVGTPGTPSESQIGVLNTSPDRPFWDVALPHGMQDNFKSTSANERRRWPRVKCSISVELHPVGQPVIWGKAADLSPGGCFVEMPIPLPAETKFEIVMWLGGTKLRLQGQVAGVSPGFGIGVRFLNISPKDVEFVQQQIKLLP